MERVFGRVTNPARKSLDNLMERLNAARSEAFGALLPAYPSIPYRGGRGVPFRRADLSLVRMGDIQQCCSDEAPFEALGTPAVTMSGDYSFYDAKHPSWAFPFDQASDTLAAMACDTGGSPVPGSALSAALDLPAAMTVSLVERYSPSHSGAPGLIMFSAVPSVGRSVKFSAIGASHTTWTFGDGGEATGSSVSHRYARAGTFTVTATAGARRTVKRIRVGPSVPPFTGPFVDVAPPRARPWAPPELEDIHGCH
jgi:hypothetical protein